MNTRVSGIVVFFTILTLFFFSDITLADTQPFNQNQSGFSGYQLGSYDTRADQPTADNWDRQSRFSAGEYPQLKWTFSIGSPILATPVIGADGTIYFGVEDGKFYAVNKNGQVKWTFITGDKISSSAAIAGDGSIYLTSKDGQLRALNDKGILQWVYNTGDIIESSPVIGADGSVYVSCKGGCLYVVDSNGNFKWKFITRGIDFPVAIGQDNSIYVSSRSGDIFCIKPDGTQKWKYHLGSNPGVPAVDKDNNVYVCSRDNLYVINPEGKIRYSCSLNQAGEVKSSLAMSEDGRLYISGDELYVYSPGWAKVQTYPVYACSTPLIGADGTIYVGSKNLSGVFSALDKNGKKIWHYNIGGIEGAPALASGGTIYIGSKDGKLYALDTYQLENVSTDPVSGENNVVIDKIIKITFNKDIYPGIAYEKIRLTDALLNLIAVHKTIDAKTLIITPEEYLNKDSKYSVRIPFDAITSDLDRTLNEDLVLSFFTCSDSETETLAEFTIGQKTYQVKGELRGMDAQPFIDNGRSFVPVRYLALALGIAEKDIGWDNSLKTVTLKKDNNLIKVSVTSNLIDVNGQRKKMDVSPVNKNSRVYLPARYIAEAFGYNVDWDETKRTVNIR